MSPEKTTLEVIAPNIDEAVQKGLSQLGIAKDSVDIEILDNGSRGIFGIGSRQARVRLTVKPESIVIKETIKPEPEVTVKPSSSDIIENNANGSSADDELALKTAHQVVTELLVKMKIKAQVVTRYTFLDEEETDRVVLVDIQGDDLSILIGRRSETLNALQYISSLIINKQMGQMVPLMIDVQGYRARRERQLRQLARRMAEQAIHTGKRQVLEPMPANERRLLHLELRDHPQVVTESIGEEPNRKVTIRLKK